MLHSYLTSNFKNLRWIRKVLLKITCCMLVKPVAEIDSLEVVTTHKFLIRIDFILIS